MRAKRSRRMWRMKNEGTHRKDKIKRAIMRRAVSMYAELLAEL